MYTSYDSNLGWHGEWFYIRKPAEVLFPPFTGRRPERLDSWSWGPTSWQKKKVEIIEAELQKLVRHGLNGVWMFHTLFRRRVAPLAEKTQPMWNHNGPTNPDRVLPKELPNDEV